MRDKLGVLLMEDSKGEISVQLFAGPEKLGEAFAELKGHPGEPSRRATMMKIQYKGGFKVESETRDLPVPFEEPPDGFRLGKGPIKLEKANGEHEENTGG